MSTECLETKLSLRNNTYTHSQQCTQLDGHQSTKICILTTHLRADASYTIELSVTTD